MIGVVAHPSEREVVTEFFELCKTPWEFCREGRSYEVVLCTREPVVQEGTRLVLVFSAEAATAAGPNLGAPNPQPSGATIMHGDRLIPLNGAAVTFPDSTFGLVREGMTHEPALHVHATRTFTVIRVGYNLFAETRHLLTQGQSIPNAGVATLELHIALLRDLVTRAGIPFVEIPPRPSGHDFIACLTHDIDHPVMRNHCFDHTMFGFLYRATVGSLLQWSRGRIPIRRMFKNWSAALKLPLVFLGLAKDCWRDFDRYVEIEADRRSTYFFIPERDKAGQNPTGPSQPKRACRYSLAELMPQLRRITAAGSEVGLHGLDAWSGAAAGRHEQTQLTAVVGKTEGGVRMHWLYFTPDSPAHLDRAGFSYDSSFGYNETVGYRAGTTQVFRPLGVEYLLELPLHVMDTALFYPDHLNLDEAEAHQLVTRMMDDSHSFGGVFTVNWHDRSIAPERLWGDFYLQLLSELQRRGAWFAPAADATAWFRMRRGAAFESTQNREGTFTVKCRLRTLDTNLPGLRLRLHRPHAIGTDQPFSTGPHLGFIDTPLLNGSENKFTL